MSFIKWEELSSLEFNSSEVERHTKAVAAGLSEDSPSWLNWHEGGLKVLATEHTQHVAWTRNKAASVSWRDKQKLPVLFFFLIISAMISYAHGDGKTF